MHFQEKSCYVSCYVPTCIKQLLRHIYYVITGHVKALEFVFYTTFHSKQLLHLHLRKQRLFNVEERSNEQGTNLAFNFPSRYILPV